MTYLWTPGQRIQVTLDDWGAPLSFTWSGHGHTVGGVAKRWRVDEEWWQARIWREYFKLYTTSGLLVIIYRDFVADQWYLQRLYD